MGYQEAVALLEQLAVKHTTIQAEAQEILMYYREK